MTSRSTRAMKIALGFIALAFCAAPVPGDVGGCGQAAEPLAPDVFFSSLQDSQCRQCQDCELETAACRRACGEKLVQSAFPEDCEPLVHDGEVCLRAFQQSGCGALAEFMSDSAPSIPPECNFCPPGGQP